VEEGQKYELAVSRELVVVRAGWSLEGNYELSVQRFKYSESLVDETLREIRTGKYILRVIVHV
jgi:hypothetical protein